MTHSYDPRSYAGWYLTLTGPKLHLPSRLIKGRSWCGRQLSPSRTLDHLEHAVEHDTCRRCHRIQQEWAACSDELRQKMTNSTSHSSAGVSSSRRTVTAKSTRTSSNSNLKVGDTVSGGPGVVGVVTRIEMLPVTSLSVNGKPFISRYDEQIYVDWSVRARVLEPNAVR
jgi:hypothetical protein